MTTNKRLQIGIRIPPCRPLRQLVTAAQKAEHLGFDRVWFPDSQLLWRDVFATLGAVAVSTEHIGLGTAVSNVVTRHPSVLASAARTIAESAPGRFALGLGVGDSAIEPAGLVPARQAELRESIAVIRSLLAGDEWEFAPGVRTRLRDPGPEVPVYMAASGPNNLRLAGELVDGLILLSGVSPATLAKALGRAQEGAQAAGRTLSDLDVCVSAYGCITDDIERDCRQLKPICARIAQKGGSTFLALAGIHVEVPPRIDGVYPDLVHAEDWDRAVERTSEWITDEMALRFASEFCLFGDIAHVTSRIQQIADAGATSLFVQHVGSYNLPDALMESFGDVVVDQQVPMTSNSD